MPKQLVCDKEIFKDILGGSFFFSSSGPFWVTCRGNDIPANIVEEIEAQIINEDKDWVIFFLASDGCRYSW